MGLNVRPGILRTYYEALFDQQEPKRFAGASFDEYLALLRLRYPRATKRWAVETAPRHGRADLASESVAKEPPDPPLDMRTELQVVEERVGLIRLLERGPVDLGKHVDKRSKALECVDGTVKNFDALTIAKWVHVEFRMCKSARDSKKASKPTTSDALRIIFSDDGCLAALTKLVRARDAHVQHDSAVDLGIFAGHKLERLSVASPSITGTITQPGLVKLLLHGATLSSATRALIESCSPSLEELTITGTVPFRPEDLPPLPRLRILTVSAFTELRTAWIDHAIRSAPALGFQFTGAANPPAGRRRK